MQETLNNDGTVLIAVFLLLIFQYYIALDMLKTKMYTKKYEFWVMLIPMIMWIFFFIALFYVVVEFLFKHFSSIYKDLRENYDSLGKSKDKPKL